MRSGRSWRHGRRMLAQLSPYRNCAALPLKEEGRSHSTMLWTHYGRWTPVRQKPAVVTTAWCASVGFSATAATRAATVNLSNEKSNERVALSESLIGWKRRLHGGCHDCVS